ncbi:MAG: pyridoxal phosphate-dependent aminotransferase [Candidatus Asgardarchaeum sp.]
MVVMSKRIRTIPPPPLSEYYKIAMELEKKGIEIIDFGQCGTDIYLPTEILTKFKKLLSERQLYEYSRPEGLPEVREAVSIKLREDNNVEYSPDEIIITAGANIATFLSVATVADPGDDLIIVAPYYFDHLYAVLTLGVNPIFVDMDETDKGFMLDVEKLEKSITPKTKAILINYPNNPTGSTFDEKTLRGIADVAIKNDLFVISDEVYEYFVYDTKHISISSLSEMKERTIMISSFSKSFGIAGWRIGYIASSREIIDEIKRIQDVVIICASLPAQYLLNLVLAIRKPLISEYREILKKRRNFIYKRLNELPWMELSLPKGGIFAFPKVEGCTNSKKLAINLLKQLGIITVPGSLFGEVGEGHLRFSFGKTPISDISEGIDRLEEDLEKIPC